MNSKVGTEPTIQKNSPHIVVRIMPAIYLKHKLVLSDNNTPSLSLEHRQVALPNITNLEGVLSHLSNLMKSIERKFLFCLFWENRYYYFNYDGSYYLSTHGPSSSVNL